MNILKHSIDWSSWSSQDDIDPVDNFREYSLNLTNNSGDDWTSPDILSQLVLKQKQIEKIFSLPMYFGSLKLKSLQEINKPQKEKSSSRLSVKNNESGYSKFINGNNSESNWNDKDNRLISNTLFHTFATPTASHDFKNFVSQFKLNKENLKQKKLTKQTSSHSFKRSKSRSGTAVVNKGNKKNCRDLKIPDKVEFNSDASFKLAKTPGSWINSKFKDVKLFSTKNVEPTIKSSLATKFKSWQTTKQRFVKHKGSFVKQKSSYFMQTERSYSALISNEAFKNTKATKFIRIDIPRKTITHTKNVCLEPMIVNEQANKNTRNEYYQNGRVY